MNPKPKSSDTIEFSELDQEVEYVTETASAYLFRFSDDFSVGDHKNQLWIPMSVCTYDMMAGVVEVQAWWARRNGLE